MSESVPHPVGWGLTVEYMAERVPTLDETIAEIREAAEGFKGIPFMPEEAVDAIVEQNIAMAKVVYAGVQALGLDEAVADGV